MPAVIEFVNESNIRALARGNLVEELQDATRQVIREDEAAEEVPTDENGVAKREKTPWNYNQARWMGKLISSQVTFNLLFCCCF